MSMRILHLEKGIVKTISNDYDLGQEMPKLFESNLLECKNIIVNFIM
jgi:hypothetical protein